MPGFSVPGSKTGVALPVQGLSCIVESAREGTGCGEGRACSPGGTMAGVMGSLSGSLGERPPDGWNRAGVRPCPGNSSKLFKKATFTRFND